MRFNFLSLICLFALSLSLSAPSLGQESGTAKKMSAEKSADKAQQQEEASDKDLYSEHLRISRDHRGRALSMDTAITRFVGENADGETIIVDLIGAVHVGEKSYFDTLNERFKQYDGMLFELVAPEGTVIPKGGGERNAMNPVAALQIGMMSGLDLTFQLEEIDYTPDNFIHADMTPEEFAKSWSQNNESVGRIFLKSIGANMAKQGQGGAKGASNLSLLSAALSSNPTLKLRRIAAEQMVDMDAGMAAFQGDNGSTIIDHRNKKAMSVLRREIDAGKKRLAIFYGAGHLNDMQERLIDDFELKRGGKTWLQAWMLRESKE